MERLKLKKKQVIKRHVIYACRGCDEVGAFLRREQAITFSNIWT